MIMFIGLSASSLPRGWKYKKLQHGGTEKKAKDDCAKDFFKLMNNAVFGKTMENVQNRVDMKFTLDEDYAVTYFSKLHFKDSRFINGLYMIEMFKKDIVYDKPCYVGTSILDLSKICLMEFHYGVIQKDFKENSNLIYSDTDSLVYSIKHPYIHGSRRIGSTLVYLIQ